MNRAGTVVVLATTQSQELSGAKVVLPITNVAEESGTFINRDRRVQLYQQAKPTPGMAQPAWWVAAAAHALVSDKNEPPVSASEAFDLVAARVPALQGLSHADLGLNGRVAGKASPAGVGA